jgi:hypothetical protein
MLNNAEYYMGSQESIFALKRLGLATVIIFYGNAS